MTISIYNHKEVESKWFSEWEKSKLYKTPELKDGDKKKYILEAFPYPSGSGLHVGHALPATGGDITSRYYRLKGYKVMHPMGWDAFGLPTENFAIKNSIPPQKSTIKSIEAFKIQLKRLGADFDWDKEINTTDPEYYKWTQWFFQLLYKRGLAYKKEALVNWDPIDKTVLANEQVLPNGTAERSGAIVEQKMMSQWFFKTTDYAERLLNDLDGLDWPESTKQMQRNWIGKSIGAEVEFAIIPPARVIPPTPFIKREDKPKIQGYIPYNTKLSDRATEMRNNPTEAEKYIWDCVLKNEQTGYKFLRQKPLDNYIVDFYCSELALIIEIDGEIHNQTIDYDNTRTAIFNSLGLKVIRFSNNQVINDIEIVKKSILNQIQKIITTTLPLDKGGWGDSITVFTTAHDTIYGVTFLVISPEHSLVNELTTDANKEIVQNYIQIAKTKSNLQRTDLNKDKTGVFSGSYAINPVNGAKIPIWIADYVLTTYGTGAVMAVPGEDERDFEFAQKYDLPIVYTNNTNQFLSYTKEIKPNKDKYTLINSDEFNGSTFEIARAKILDKMIAEGDAKPITNYRLRDWSIGRQRYWGCPIPVMYNQNQINSDKVILIDAINTLFKEIDFDNNQFELNTELAKFLDSLPDKKIILTNAPQSKVEVLQEILKPFNWEISSQFNNPNKINSDYYQNVINKYNLDLDKTFYFDHSKDNLKSATNAEINTVQYLSNKQIISILDDRNSGQFLVPESDLPLKLPEDVDMSNGKITPLGQNQKFINSASDKYDQDFTYEGDTMDSFVCSSWYFFRYCSPNNQNLFADLSELKKWMPIDQYIIGAEHSTLHLLYARFFTKVLFDEGLIDFNEPFKKMLHQGLILGPDNQKMSKSKGNVVDPNDIFDQYGADTLRMYEMFMGPFDQPKPWNTDSIKGVRRFIDRVWNLQERVYFGINQFKDFNELQAWGYTCGPRTESTINKALHRLTKKIGEDIESYSFNTCISEFMKFINLVEETGAITIKQVQTFLILLAPFAPFITEEIWQNLTLQIREMDIKLGRTVGQIKINDYSIHTKQWPSYSEEMLVNNEVKIVIQINGKVRTSFEIAINTPESEIIKQAIELGNKWIDNKNIKFTKYIPNKLVTIVTD